MTVTPSRVFIARLSGVAVFAPNGDQVGKVRDVVVTLRSKAQPRVLGMVVEVTGRRRIFVPMTRITAIDAGRVVTTGVVNLRQFRQRPSETLVLGELLDRKATLSDEPGGADAEGTSVTVQDVAMEQARTRDWFVSKVAVRQGGSGFRRRGETHVVDWDRLGSFLLAERQGADTLIASFEGQRASDVAVTLHELTPKRRSEIASAMADEKLADVLEELPEVDQVGILEKLDEERAADILEEMDPDDAADLIAELPDALAAKLLRLMEPEDAEDVRRLMAYGKETAGGMMTTEPVILPHDATVAEALARIRHADLNPAIAAQVFVVRAPLDIPTGKFIGLAHFQRLLRERPSALVSGIVDTALEGVPPEMPRDQVARLFAAYNLVALPVVDDQDRLIGVVTVDDVVDHMLPGGWREDQHSEQVQP